MLHLKLFDYDEIVKRVRNNKTAESACIKSPTPPPLPQNKSPFTVNNTASVPDDKSICHCRVFLLQPFFCCLTLYYLRRGTDGDRPRSQKERGRGGGGGGGGRGRLYLTLHCHHRNDSYGHRCETFECFIHCKGQSRKNVPR